MRLQPCSTCSRRDVGGSHNVGRCAGSCCGRYDRPIHNELVSVVYWTAFWVYWRARRRIAVCADDRRRAVSAAAAAAVALCLSYTSCNQAELCAVSLSVLEWLLLLYDARRLKLSSSRYQFWQQSCYYCHCFVALLLCLHARLKSDVSEGTYAVVGDTDSVTPTVVLQSLSSPPEGIMFLGSPSVRPFVLSSGQILLP